MHRRRFLLGLLGTAVAAPVVAQAATIDMSKVRPVGPKLIPYRYGTGARDYLNLYPHQVEAMQHYLSYGAEKYGARNWS